MAHDPDQYQAFMAPLTTVVVRLIEETRRQLEEHLLPDVDSPAMSELAVHADYAVHESLQTPVVNAHTAVGQYVAAGCDHLQAVCTLHDAEPAVVYGDRVLLRAAIEAFARAAWLAEPVPVEERVRRGVNDRLDSMTNQIEFSKLFGDGSKDARDALRSLRDDIANRCAAAGLGELGRKDGAIWVGGRRYGPSRIIRWFGEQWGGPNQRTGDVLQAAYSAFTHSTLWALTSRIEVGESLDLGDVVLAGTTVAPLVADGRIAVRMLGTGSFALVVAVEHQRTLMNWSGDDWVAARHGVAEVLDSYELDTS